MFFFRTFLVTLVSLVGAWIPAAAQINLTPRLNIPLPVGATREYGTPHWGYGGTVGYQFFPHWEALAAYDRYRFELNTSLKNLNVDPNLIILLNLPETITLSLSSDTWNSGVHYRRSFARLSAYVGAEISTNRIVAEGYGIRIIRHYWGLAPVVGADWMFTARWGAHVDTRLQTIFTRQDIPFVNQVIDEYLMFLPIQAGITAKISW